MSKFKVGDRVKRLDSGINGVVKGQTYTVSHFDGYRGVKLEGYGDFTFSAESFVLAPAFPINSGDYIDSREFTREECERFCELAVECGFGRGSGFERLTDLIWWALGVHKSDGHLFAYAGGGESLTSNITTKFREFLDKEKGMEQFTKDDLKDGDKIYISDDDICFPEIPFYVGGEMAVRLDYYKVASHIEINNMSDNFVTKQGRKVKKIVRDGTVLFNRDDTVRQERLAKIESLRNELNKLEELL